MHLLVRFVINALALYLIARYIPGFNHDLTVWNAAIAAVIFGLVNALIGPILRLIAFPITVLTLGLFSIVVNYALFALAVYWAPGFRTTGEINPWLANFYGALIMMVVSTIAQALTRRDRDGDRRESR